MAGESTKKKKSHSKGKTTELKAELEKKEKEARELKDLLQRVQADFENAMKRKEKEIAIREEKARARVLRDFLVVLDSVDEALKHSQADSGLDELRKQFWQVFQQHSVSEITVGKEFNPHTMECVMRESIPGKEHETVLEEFQKGYLFKGSVLRPAKVKVNFLKEKKGSKPMGVKPNE